MVNACIGAATYEEDVASDTARRIDVLRLLTQFQDDISPQDMFTFWPSLSWEVAAAEFLYSNNYVPSGDEEIFPFLVTAFRGFVRNPSQWESLLRRLLRNKPDLHSRVPRACYLGKGETFPCEVSEYRTPLDELLGQIETPFEAEEIADRWLQVLLGEGFDVVAYLEEEYALHAQQMRLTVPWDGR